MGSKNSSSKEPPKILIGRWLLESVDASEPTQDAARAYIEFRPKGRGEFACGSLRGWLDCRYRQTDAQWLVEFSWAGQDETMDASGRGWARLGGNGLSGALFTHNADEIALSAVRPPGRARLKIARAPRQTSGAEPAPVQLGPLFERYIGIDYSGAETSTARLKGLRIYEAAGDAEAREVPTPAGPHKHWTRREIAEWLVALLHADGPILVGIDHAFSFPHKYFKKHRLPLQWTHFLDDFCEHWPTDAEHTYVDFVRDGLCGRGSERQGHARWKRLTEVRTGTAKSVFHFDVPGSVAKSTHAGLPWLRYVRQHAPATHFWPFDGWSCPRGRSVLAEAYPRLWSTTCPKEDRTADQHDAFSLASKLRDLDRTGQLTALLHPPLSPAEKRQAEYEGWILGVP